LIKEETEIMMKVNKPNHKTLKNIWKKKPKRFRCVGKNVIKNAR